MIKRRLTAYKRKKSIWSLSKPYIMIAAAKENKGYNFIIELLKFILILFEVLVLLCRGLYSLSLSITGDNPSVLITNIINIVIVGICGLFMIPRYYFIEKTSIRNMGFVKNGMIKEYLWGMLCGTLSFCAVIGISVLLGTVKFEGVSLKADTVPFIALMLPLYMFQSAGEEIMFRGYFLSTFSRRHNLWLSAVLCGVLCAAIHWRNYGMFSSPFPVINIVLVGIVLSLSVIKRGNIWFACGAHGLWNYVQGNILGMSVSGMDSGYSVLSFSAVSDKPAVITGGVFGLEASPVTTAVLLILLITILLINTKDVGKA